MGAVLRIATRRRVRRAPEWVTGTLLFLPAVALVSAFQVYPLVRGVVRSLHDPDTGGWSAHNYSRMVHDPAWLRALRNAGEIVLLVPLFVVIPLLLAFALFQAFWGWKFFRAVFFLSWLTPPVIVGYMFVPLLTEDGPLNHLLRIIGLGALTHAWLGESGTALWAVMAIFFWSIFGLGVGIYLAGLATIPVELVEAARLDGASRLRALRHVVVPLLLPTIAVWSVFVLSALLLGLYAFVYSLTGGGPSFASLTPEFYIVSVLLNEVNPNYAAALSTTLFAAVLAVVLVQMRFLYGRIVED
jgi:multiple sugar transport system permease protein